MPEGVEMALKLMVPLEVSRIYCAPRYAYQGRQGQGQGQGGDCPVGISGEDHVEFEVQLISFLKEGHWQVSG